MAKKHLVIVESPAKAKTIGKYLGKDYEVKASMGHLRDLPKSKLGVDIEHDFEPVYQPIRGKEELISELKKAAKSSDTVYLATDPDREGEAISWHLKALLNLDDEKAKRVTFNEITKKVVSESIKEPRAIDQDLVDAQQARRVLDRIVGFELSPVLWKKIKPALSAGRVQSVAVRLICEREEEIGAFVSEPFFRVNALFQPHGGKMAFKAELARRLADEKEARDFLDVCAVASFAVKEVSVKPLRRSPQPPFTTSTLQQEASRRLGFSVNQTMVVAQKLYEEGKITYMRTDSTNLSDLALKSIADEITRGYGAGYLKTRRYHTQAKGAQEAHEAIRPTYADRRSIEGTEQEKRLYDLIWRRAVASQMADAEIEKTSVDISVAGSAELFKAEGEVVKFDGFLSVYRPQAATAGEDILPPMKEGTALTPREITATQRFTQAPPRYTEATLVKKMEDLGIGRPSTYAPTISTIQARDYVQRGEKEGVKRSYDVLTLRDGKVTKTQLSENSGSERGRLVPTDVGMVVNRFLTEYFPDILDYNFTARVEEKFDEIAEGRLGWKEEISGFYGGFHPEIEKINSLRMAHKVGERQLGVDPASGRPVSVKIGRFGPVVQVGEVSDSDKPLFASLLEGQSIQSITLEEALKLFELPRTLGEYEGKKVSAAIGRFGPYIQHDGKYVSIPKDKTPQGITLDEAIELIEAKRQEEANKFIKAFDDIPGLEVLNGRYGPYMAYKPEGAKKAVNYKIPKDTDPHALTAEEARKLMQEQDAAPRKTQRRSKK